MRPGWLSQTARWREVSSSSGAFTCLLVAIVAMEASSGAHHWCRKLVALGLDARIIPAQMVSPSRLQGKGGKNDANDAAAICEAASRPQMHFVTAKTIAQQGMLCVHRVREGC